MVGVGPFFWKGATMNLDRIDDWHLHVTVQPRNNGMMPLYVERCEKMGWQPKVLENHLGDDGVATMHELVPTVKLHNEPLGRAMILLHDVAKFFALSGWIVPRMKIEGRVQHADALYAEVHVLLHDDKVPEGWRVPLSRSLTSGRLYATVRSVNTTNPAVNDMRAELIDNGAIGAHEEWTVYDSNRALDAFWMQSWGRQG